VGDLQAIPSPQHGSFYRLLADLLTVIQLTHLGDPPTPVYTPNSTPLDHWLMRIPTEARQPPPTTTTAIHTEFSDNKALLAKIPQIGDPKLDTYPTTRDQPPFILPIPKPLIDLYQLGDKTTRTAQEETLLSIQQLTDSDQVTTDQIDIAAKMVVETIDSYHHLAQTIWLMAQPPPRDTNIRLHPPITKSDTRQLKRITRLRNTAKGILPKPKTNTPITTDSPHTIQTRTQASEVLQLPVPPNLENIMALCHKAIAVITNKADRKLADSLRKKEDQLYKRALSATTTTLKPRRAYNPMPKNSPNLKPYEIQPPMT
jgi:hypothetical protein